MRSLQGCADFGLYRAVAILVVFAILLTRGSETPKDGVFSHTWLAGLAIAAAMFAVLGLGGAGERQGIAA